jgi:hypothetical protein
MTGMLIPLIAATLAGGSAPAPDGQVMYRKQQFLGDGYTEKSVGPQTWQIVAIIRPYKPVENAGKMAMYRAAELATKNGFSNVRIVSHKQKIRTNYSGVLSIPAGVKYTLVAEATNAPAATGHCETNVSETCESYAATAALAEFAPNLRFFEAK